jgi:hypothetical protein
MDREEAAYMSEKKTRIATEESQSGRYAVIEIRRNEVFPKRFVISYRDEESLRELIAAPRIIGIGFGFREAAVEVVPSIASTDDDSKNIREKPVFRGEEDRRGPQSTRQHPRHRLRLTETRRIACATLQNAVLAGVLMFHSRSVLGAVIRAFVCA